MNEADFLSLPVEQIRSHGLQIPRHVCRSGVYLLTFADGDRYLGRTNDIVTRVGGHSRCYEDITGVEFLPTPSGDLDATFRACEARLGALNRNHFGEDFDKKRTRRSNTRADPFSERIRWMEENLAEGDVSRPPELPDQRERTRPNFDRLGAHADFDPLCRLIALFLERVVPAPAATERRNWVITSMPSTARTRVWHRLICLSVNNVEALTIGEQFEGARWTVAGFLSAAATTRATRSLLPEGAVRKGGYIAPAYYQTVGKVSQIGFDSLAALKPLLDSDRVLDLVSELVMRLMWRGTGLYGRFHDYNLADIVLGLEPNPPVGGTAGREGFEPSEAL